VAIMEERQRFQRELHDAIKQQLFATAMHIAAARAFFITNSQQAYRHIVEAEQVAGHTQRELTALIFALRPDDLDGKPLATALTDLCQRWTHQTGIPVEMAIDASRIPPVEVEAAFYRVAQESLANIARHSEATQAQVTLHWESDTLVLTIADNGHGFDTAAHTAHTEGIGLRSMQERLSAIGGAVLVESGTEGTCVEARALTLQGASSNE